MVTITMIVTIFLLVMFWICMSELGWVQVIKCSRVSRSCLSWCADGVVNRGSCGERRGNLGPCWCLFVKSHLFLRIQRPTISTPKIHRSCTLFGISPFSL